MDDDVDSNYQEYCNFYGNIYNAMMNPAPVTNINLDVPIILSSKATNSASNRSLDESRNGERPNSSTFSNLNITSRYEGPDPNPSDLGDGTSLA